MTALVAVGVACAGAATANAATVKTVVISDCGHCERLSVVYTAGAGEANRVTLAHAGFGVRPDPGVVLESALAVTETGATLTAEEGCVGGAAAAVCLPPLGGLSFFSFGGAFVDAGDGDDVVTLVDTLRERVVCGPGNDVVIADVEDSVDGDCEEVTRL